MARNENKTQPTDVSPEDFVEAIEHKVRRQDGLTLLSLFNRITGLKPVMWGPSIIGYGRYHYRYESGREGDFLLTGFSPRKAALSLYIMSGFQNRSDQLERLGKHKTGRGCLYINKLADIDMNVLEEMIRDDMTYMRANYQTWDT